MKRRPTPKHQVGEIRPSQVLSYYGIGSVIDLPNISAMVMGLESWDQMQCAPIAEERLRTYVQELLGPQVKDLKSPPIPENDSFNSDETALVGIPVGAFPRWMVCPKCRLVAPLSSEIFKLKHSPYRPDQTRYIHENCTKFAGATVLPARFVVACEHGHMDDFPWVYFVHRGQECTGIPRLRLLETGVTGEAADVFIMCETCKTGRSMSQAFGREGEASMPMCRGRRPHLNDFDSVECDQQMRTVLLGASNSWFSVVQSALSLPTSINPLRQLVDRHWSYLEDLQSEREVSIARRQGLKAFSDYSDDEIFHVIQQVHNDQNMGPQLINLPLKVPEWHMFTNPAQAPQTNDFRLKEVEVPQRYKSVFDRIVLVDRLREVRALVGFTRLTSLGEIGEVDDMREMLAPLSRSSPTWIPASEVRGEGIFLQWNEAKIEEWMDLESIIEQNRLFANAHDAWCRNRRIPQSRANYPSVRYVLLHSFAHALMRQLALECGYTSASLSERIYSIQPLREYGPMAGILIYTSASDSEGTLGGLVRLGSPSELERHIDKALESLYWCSSDPLCAEHKPDINGLVLHGAACHACLFAPETSCERGNRFLDRTVLIPTIEERDIAFFPFALQSETNLSG